MGKPRTLDDRRDQQGFAAALQRAADIVALGAAWLAAFCIAGLTLLVLTDTLLAFLSRRIPGVPTSTGIGWEYSAYLMGAAFLLGSGLTLRAGLQLRVELLMSIGGARLVRFLDCVSAALGTAVTVALTIWFARFTLRTYGFGEVSESSFTPLWIPRLVLTIGMGVFAFQTIARLVTCVAGNPVDRPELGAATAIE
jgi:TRAP-type mannitol/chloroaromatic compound transport system permease small subunit